MRLHQCVALQAGKKTRARDALTALYKKFAKPGLLQGHTKTYSPKDEDGEVFPPENNLVRVRARDEIREVNKILADTFDTVATVDKSNTMAKADIVVDDVVLLRDVPQQTLLFLRDQFKNLRTLAESIPELDPAYSWTFSEAANCYVSPPEERGKTKKVPKNHVKAEATQHHPAQVEVYYEDIPVGKWTQVSLSGAVPASEKAETVEKVRKMHEALKVAVGEANLIEVEPMEVGEVLLQHVFGS